MNEKQVKEIKDAKQKVVEGSLTLWNARFDALKEAGYTVELINHIAWTDICGCGGGSPVCFCNCPPVKKCSDQPEWDSGINEMNKAIVELGQEIKRIKEKIKI